MKKLLLSFLIVGTMVPFAIAQRAENRIPSDLKIVKDIVYKTVDGKALDLWLFPPAENKAGKAPLVVYIHGGGWGGGDKTRVFKSHVIDVVRRMTKAGVACATIEYRLTVAGKSTAYDAAADCKDAVQFLARNADKYRLDPDRIGLIGTSAGGHLVLVTALGDDADYPCEKSAAPRPGKIRCVAAFYPATSFINSELLKGSNFERPQRFVPLLGGTVDQKREIATKLSPTELVRKDSPAILLAHGEVDTTLSVKHSTVMAERAREKGVPVELIVVKGGGHGFKGDQIEPSEAEVSRRTAEFFLKYLTR